MDSKQNGIALKIITAVTYAAMIAVNAMANALPINGIDTGAVSDAYPNLFAPAGLTFAIWGLIYLLLAGYTLYQFGLFQGDKSIVKTELLRKVDIVFSISSLANFCWIFSWHYRIIPLSMVLMLVILACLMYINGIIKKEQLSNKEKLFIKLPFSVYFGWITVATIANMTVLLVDIGWNGFGISEPIWAVIILITGLVDRIGDDDPQQRRRLRTCPGLGLCRHPAQAHVPNWFRGAISERDHDGHRLHRPLWCRFGLCPFCKETGGRDSEDRLWAGRGFPTTKFSGAAFFSF